MSDPQTSGFLSKGEKLLSNLLEILRVRVELFGIELQEEKHRIIDTLLWASITVFLGAMAVVIMTITLIFLFWESPEARLAALSGLSVLYLSLTWYSLVQLKRKMKNAAKPFRESLRAIEKDRECLRT